MVEEPKSESSNEGKYYSTLLDHIPIPEDLFSRINFSPLESCSLVFLVDSDSSHKWLPGSVVLSYGDMCGILNPGGNGALEI